MLALYARGLGAASLEGAREACQHQPMNFVTHLECANCFERYDPALVHNLCTACQRPLVVKYDLARVKRAVTKATLAGRRSTL